MLPAVATLHPPSSEQRAIVDAIVRGASVIVDAVAGSGKTTSVLHVGEALRGRRVLHLTYNARLKDETRQRVLAASLKSTIEAHSFHAAGLKYWGVGTECFTDAGLQALVSGKLPLRDGRALPRWDLVVVDEAQDMTPLFHAFVVYLLKEMHAAGYPQPQLLILGDAMQALYAFRESDARFLTRAYSLYPDHPGEGQAPRTWERLPLRISYRITGCMAALLNSAFMGYDHIVPAKPAGAPVEWVVGGGYDAVDYVADKVVQLIRDHAFAPGDVFVLAHSLRRSNTAYATPLTVLENKFAAAKVPVHASTSDDAELDPDVAQGKLVISTIHQSKGLERRLVIVYGANASWYKYGGGRDHTPAQRAVCPPVWYVAMTRATERLIVLGEESNRGHLPFVDRIWIERESERAATERAARREAAASRRLALGAAVDAAPPPPVGRAIGAAAAPVPGVVAAAPPGAATAPAAPAATRPPAVTITWAPNPKRCKVQPLTSAQLNGGPLPLEPQLLSDDEEWTRPVTSLTRFLPESLLRACRDLMRPERVADAEPVQRRHAVPVTVAGRVAGREPVADLTGLALPAMLEAEACGGGKRTTMALALKGSLSNRDVPAAVRDRVGAVLALSFTHPSHYLRLASLYEAANSGYVARLQQLPPECGWLEAPAATAALSVLRRHVPTPALALFEVEHELTLRWPIARGTSGGAEGGGGGSDDAPASLSSQSQATQRVYRTVTIQGIVDVLTPDALIEVKCTKNLNTEHMLQLAFYAYLWQHPATKVGGVVGGGESAIADFVSAAQAAAGAQASPRAAAAAAQRPTRAFRIVNMLTKEAWELHASFAELERVVALVVRHAVRTEQVDPDEAFIARALLVVADPGKAVCCVESLARGDPDDFAPLPPNLGSGSDEEVEAAAPPAAASAALGPASFPLHPSDEPPASVALPADGSPTHHHPVCAASVAGGTATALRAGRAREDEDEPDTGSDAAVAADGRAMSAKRLRLDLDGGGDTKDAC